jgi:ribosome recycling factor
MNDIQLTAEQRKALEKLWFIYGNQGKKHTHHNHRFIQNFLEHNEDSREFYLNADRSKTLAAGIDWETIGLTQECIDAVDKILKS